MAAKLLVSKRWSLALKAFFFFFYTKEDGDVKYANWATKIFTPPPPPSGILAQDQHVCSMQTL